MIHAIAKPMSLILIFSFMVMNVTVIRANAAMVGTEAVLNVTKESDARDRISAFLDRQNVQSILKARGISPQEAKARVDTLSDAEVVRMASALEQLPAGGDALGLLIGTAFLVFIILLITDLLGLTHVFPFVYHRR
jgi:hypothetical protein